MNRGRSYLAIIVFFVSVAAPRLGFSQAPQGTQAPLTTETLEKRASLYRYAVELFSAGQFEEAFQIFQSIASQYPNYIPAQIGLARSHYHLERMVEAYKAFAKVPLKTLSDEVAYEYAYSHFANRDYENALKGFRRVRRGNKLFGMANYFGAVAAVKTNRYQVASRMIDNAVNLPRKYAISRELYEKHIDEIMADKQASELKTKEGKVKAEKAPDAKPAEYAHGGFQGIAKGAAFATEFKRQYTGYQYEKNEENDFRTNSFTFKTGYMYAFTPTQKRSAVVGVNGVLAAQQKDSATAEIKADDEPKDRDIAFTKKADVAGQLFYEHPFAESLWASVSLSVEQSYPDLGAEFGSNDKSVGFLLGMQGDITTTGNISYNNSADSEAPLYSFTEESGSVSSTVFGCASTLTLRARQFSYLKDSQSGEQTDYKGTLEVGLPQFWDIKTTLKGNVQLQKDMYDYGVPGGDVAEGEEKKEGTATYDIMSYSGVFSISRKFFGWLSLSGEALGEKRSLQNIQIVDAAGAEFPEVEILTKEYNFISYMAGKISIDLAF
ncbi:MAG: tetratricopeptide repeat protein [Oligoflexales bacterium]